MKVTFELSLEGESEREETSLGRGNMEGPEMERDVEIFQKQQAGIELSEKRGSNSSEDGEERLRVQSGWKLLQK